LTDISSKAVTQCVVYVVLAAPSTMFCNCEQITDVDEVVIVGKQTERPSSPEDDTFTT
jgi:hypothetical protein